MNKSIIDLNAVKYPGIKHEVFEQLQEALKKDYTEHMKSMKEEQ